MECLWDMFRSIPSLENPGMTVLDETYYLNKNDPNYSLERAIWSGGKSATTFDLTFSPRVNEQMQALMMTPEDELDDKPISEFFDDEFFSTPFWLYYSTMFAFQKWHSALEFKRYCLRFAHHASDIGGAGAFSDMLFMKYNQYESFVLPMLSYLEDHGVKVTYNTTVTDIRFDCRGGKKVATQMTTLHDGKEETIALTESDFVFTTLGSNVENSTIGTHHTAPSSSWRTVPARAGRSGRRSPPSLTISAIPISSAARCRRACLPPPRWILTTRPMWRRSAIVLWAAAGPAPAALSL